MTLNHIHIGTKNLLASQKFYEAVFGFQKKFDHGTGVFLENDAGFLIAIDPVEELPNFPSWYHIGFCLTSEDQAHAMYRKCKELNIKIVRDLIKEQGQFASFYIIDPDGYKIEISWHNE
jgi:catechol 2,3-dioxygenase-like lactoylglutathione lyase family enzyme